ncbi:ATPase, T2SS/T4P/T4SS family [Noviherbaspirillum galbum]|uniref:Flp pilus assembly complex ATPase component n=1 Tax=Noviherbaspirillum galbum TaxID=2709383 RepID=A0A6B3SRJ2_9BURK|nr:ATPase, T2SS/T4P/T4SS family [Noviherbaspirillum galbum]NEX63363.1 Flp pilus assembly complex ATPase component [Noviherbaspirillum galbum]
MDHITDLHLKNDELHNSLVFPGPRKIDDAELDEAKQLLTRCQTFQKTDFMVSHEGRFWRGRRDANAVDGQWFRLRKMPPEPPSLEKLPSPIASGIHKLLLSKQLKAGGLIYIVGSPGSGKTTTASATVVSRLRAFGGVSYTVEDPPEMPLNGWHDKGYCSQTWVAGDQSADWAESLRGVLRSQPASTPVILYVGEVRDAASAEAMLRAASNGFLVIATGFGTDIITGIDQLIRLGSEESMVGIAAMLRLVVHQRLMDGALVASCLASSGADSRVAARIRAGQLPHLSNDINFQSNMMRNGQDPLEMV